MAGEVCHYRTVGGALMEVLPHDVGAAEAVDLASVAELRPEEQAAAVNHVPSRRAEFATGRRCARQALGRLGFDDAERIAIPVGPQRRPIGPSGVVGSISHCAGRCAAVVEWDHRYGSVGIDVEVRNEMSLGVRELTTHPDDAVGPGADPDVEWSVLLFSARESVFKCWFPVTRSWLGHQDVLMSLDVLARTFAVAAAVSMAPDRRRWLASLRGAFTWTDDHVYTAAWTPAEPRIEAG